MVALFPQLPDAEWISQTRDICLKGITESTIWAGPESIFSFSLQSAKKLKSLRKYTITDS